MSDKYQTFILERISKGDYSLSPRRKGRSIKWSILSEIIKEDGVTLEDYLYCRTCLNILKYSAKQSSNLSRHKCCLSLKECLKSVPPEDKDAAIDNCIAWLTEDRQPFAAVSGAGFYKLARFFVSIGAKHGENIDIEDLLPDAATISCLTQQQADDKRKEIIIEVAEAVHSGGASATVYLWTDNFVQRTFIGVAFHYQKNLKLYDIILGVKSMDVKHTNSADIFKKLKSLFSEYGIHNIDGIKFVTDGGFILAEALRNNIHLNCSSHLFANALEQSFMNTAEIAELLGACKKIVKYFKKSNLQSLIQTPAKFEYSVGWSSYFALCRSVMENWPQISKLLKEVEEGQMLLLINISALKQLVHLFNDFEVIFKKLQLSSSPSLCFVIPSINKIKHLCVPKTSDLPSIQSLKEKIIYNIDSMWAANLNLWHKTAFFLFPPALRMETADLNDIKNFYLSQIDNSYQTNTRSSTSYSNPTSPGTDLVLQIFKTENGEPEPDSDAESSNQSSFKDVHFFFPDLLKKSKPSNLKSPALEFEKYCNESVELTDDFDVLKWWKLNEKSYPNLSKLALQIHSIPSSSTAVKRDFSMAGNLVTEKINHLGSKSVNSILFLNSYFKNVRR